MKVNIVYTLCNLSSQKVRGLNFQKNSWPLELNPKYLNTPPYFKRKENMLNRTNESKYSIYTL